MTIRPEVLLVDDDPAVLHALNKLLGAQVVVRSVTSGQAAIDLLETSPTDLIMLDLDMPGLSGFDVLNHLKGSNRLAALPVIVVSARDEAEVEARVLNSGAADFIAKPFAPAHVLARVRTQLQLQRIKARACRLDPTLRGPTSASGILIVDDDVQSIHALRAMLAPLTGEVRFASRLSDAMRAIESGVPDLIVLDMQLADGTGFDLCVRLREDPWLCRVPVLIITRFDDEANEVRAYELGAMDFVSKRCGAALLQARVRKLLRLKGETDDMFMALDRHWRQHGETRLAMMVEASSDGILSVDERGTISLINQAACELLGVTRETALHRSVRVVLAEGAGQQALLIRLLGTQNPTGTDSSLIALRGADGEVRLVEPRCFQLRDHGSTLNCVALRDVTEREAASLQLREQAKALAGREARAMMLSSVVHEIGNPLNAIIGFSQLMLCDPQGDANAERVRHIHAAGEHLTHLMADLRDVGLLELGQFRMSMDSFELVSVIELAIDEVRPAAIQFGVELVSSFNPAGAKVTGDPHRLRQCLVNLLTNGVKYNRSGGRVEVQASFTTAMAMVTIADTGIGMTPEQLTHLFKPFQRLGQEKTSIPGTGLGLVVTKMLVEAMGGSLTVNSEPGEGSCFTLVMPLSATQR